MGDVEGRALKRATIVLLIVSILRWTWSLPERPGPVLPTILPELLSASEEATAEEAARTAPLSEGERIDPNSADEIQLDRLPGVGEVTARSIIAARDSGLVFRRPGDLTAVRGVGPALVGRIATHLTFETARSTPLVGVSGASRPAWGLIDINRADARQLEELPGVGPAIAARIVAERRKQMFFSVDDLERVRGVGPATVERLRSLVTVGRSP